MLSTHTGPLFDLDAMIHCCRTNIAQADKALVCTSDVRSFSSCSTVPERIHLLASKQARVQEREAAPGHSKAVQLWPRAHRT